jgi:hypothetical protein
MTRERGFEMKVCIALTVAILLATPAFAFEKKSYTMRDDFGSEPVADCYMSYYYYVPCPTYSWFWGFYGWSQGDVIGTFFMMGDVSTFTGAPCDPMICFRPVHIRVLDFAGYGSIYPGLYTVEFDIYCADEQGCPVGHAVWSSGPYETGFAWNYVPVTGICLPMCAVQFDPMLSYVRMLVTATMVGTDCTYPQWGFDNISTPALGGCEFHDYSCLGALYPRPYSSHYETIHSGYYGPGLSYCPPRWFCDGRDTSPEFDQYGYVEAAWRIYMACEGPTSGEPSTWGNIKTMYR